MEAAHWCILVDQGDSSFFETHLIFTLAIKSINLYTNIDLFTIVFVLNYKCATTGSLKNWGVSSSFYANFKD